MNVNNKYFDLIVENNRFHIVELETKPKQSNAALATLKKIDYIINNKIAYDSTANDKYSNYTKDQLYELLKQKGIQIFNNFNEKNQNSLIQNTRVNSIMTRIINLTVFPLTADATYEITKNLDIADLGALAQVNRHAKRQTDLPIIQLAKKLGFTGDTNVKANEYLRNLCKDFKKLLNVNKNLQKYFYKQDKFINILLKLSNELSIEDLITILFINYLDYPNVYNFLLKCTDDCLKKNSLDTNNPLLDKNNPSYEMFSQCLLIASFFDKESMVKILLKYGANINIRNHQGSTPLMYATQQGHKRLVQFLIENKADLNVPHGTSSRTPLHEAVHRFHTEIVKQLLEHGANIDKQNRYGQTALMSLLYSIKVDEEMLPLKICFFGRSQADRIEENNNSIKEMVQLLLRYGADVNIRDNSQNSALHMAIDMNYYGVIELLVQHPGTNVNILNMNNKTPLAVMNDRFWPYENIIKLLKDHGGTL